MIQTTTATVLGNNMLERMHEFVQTMQQQMQDDEETSLEVLPDSFLMSARLLQACKGKYEQF